MITSRENDPYGAGSTKIDTNQTIFPQKERYSPTGLKQEPMSTLLIVGTSRNKVTPRKNQPGRFQFSLCSQTCYLKLSHLQELHRKI